MSITITTLLFYAEQFCSFLTLSDVQGVWTYYPAILITNFYLDVQWTPFLLIKFGGNTIRLHPKFAQTKFSRTKFARPHLPQPKFAQTQICPKPNLPRPKFAQAKFAQTHICPSQICPEPSLPQKKYMCQKINKIVKFLWTETQKFQIFTTFLP